jgi:hypothetical protein
MSEQRIVTAPVASLNYDMTTHPSGHKCLLLTDHLMLVEGTVVDTTGYIAWAPLPKRDKQKEKELGL